MHVLICTVFISVYGQGFALRGPLGSMAKAVDGMVSLDMPVYLSLSIAMLGTSRFTSKPLTLHQSKDIHTLYYYFNILALGD